MAKKKFDTNQLDPEFPTKVAAEAAATAPQQFASTSVVPQPEPEKNDTNILPDGPATRVFEEPPTVEDQATRKFDGQNFSQFQNPYDGQFVPGPYQAPHPPFVQPDSTRKVAKIGIPENIMTALPYVPFYLGLVSGLLALFFVPKSEAKVRFHAAQGVAAHLAILVVSAILKGMANITNLAHTGEVVFNIVTTVMLIVFAVKAFQGKPIHLEFVDDLTNWLEDKIKPSE